MKKYSIASVSAISATVACLVLIAPSALAATPLTGSVTTSLSGVTTGGTNSVMQTAASSGSSVNTDTGVNVGTDVGVSASTNPSTTANYNGTLNASINIDSDDAQLTAYAQSIAENDPSVKAISTTDNNVSISYKVPVRLFGFIPVNETETASVDTSANGSATANVHRSWWSFLAAGNNSSDSSAFSSAINTRLGTSGAVSSQADVMANIEAAAQSSMATSASGSASTGY